MPEEEAMGTPTALIVEDDADIAEFMTEALRNAGFTTQTIGDGRQAMTRLAEATPDVVVLDLHLPYVSGEAILRYIRAEARLKNAYVLLTTGEAQQADSIKDQADLVLLKPISYTQLHDLALRVRSSLARGDSRDEAADA
jgi:DNA-binding response OmpR family regulator